jgi:hypothetical protein
LAVGYLAAVFGPDDDIPADHPANESPWGFKDVNYWLYLSDVTVVKPVPYKGALGLFKVPYDIAMNLEAFSVNA